MEALFSKQIMENPCYEGQMESYDHGNVYVNILRIMWTDVVHDYISCFQRAGGVQLAVCAVHL